MDDGETLEFFNPFINYEIVNNKPLLDSYPTYIDDNYIGYIQSGGIIKRKANDYVLLLPVVFGAHKHRAIYYATSTNLESWTFHKRKILDTNSIEFAKKDGNIFSTNNPFLFEENKYLVLLGVECPDGNYTAAYMIIDSDLNIIQKPTKIRIPQLEGNLNSYYPLSIINHDGVYRFLIYDNNRNYNTHKIYEVTTLDILKNFNEGINNQSLQCIIDSETSSGYLKGKMDDASYITYNSELYIIIGSEEYPSEYLTSLNREYGLIHLDKTKWAHDNRSPLIINPMTLHHKFPELEWAADHLGGFILPIFKDNYLYLFLTMGSDNPDYLLSGIKLKLE